MSITRAVFFASALALSATAAYADGNAEAGAKEFNVCKACHTIDAGGPNRVGPNLHGIVGRKAGSAAGFAYSKAMQDAGHVWDEAKLNDYLKDPKTAVPGNKMAFAGVKDDAKRADLIAYLKSQSE